MKYMSFRSGKRWMSFCFLLFTALLVLHLGIRTCASETVHSAPVKTASFPTQVYNFEKLLEAENDVLSFRVRGKLRGAHVAGNEEDDLPFFQKRSDPFCKVPVLQALRQYHDCFCAF